MRLSSGSIPCSASHFKASLCSVPIKKLPDTTASSVPERIRSVDVFPPSKRVKEPINIDFPAPVSPLKTFKPFSNSTKRLSIKAMFFTDIFSSIYFP